MLRNYVLVALRSFQRRLGHAVINVVGLGVGIACCAAIALYVWGERSYDRFHEDYDRTYRIESIWGGGDFSLPATNWPFVQALRTERPDLTIATLLQTNSVVRREERSFREDVLLIANDAFFDIFSFRLDQGDEKTALSEPYTVVLSRETAERYFGDENPVGQVLRMFGDTDFTVTGIFAPSDGPTHIPLTALISWPTLDATGWTANQRWSNNSVKAYIRFPEGVAPEAFAASLPDIIKRHAGESWNGSVLGIQRLEDIHLYSKHSAELAPGGNPGHVKLFSLVALFILVLAGVNFVNLSTARSLERAREVGVRKSVGATARQLARQFLGEALLLSLLALLIAVAILTVVLPLIANLAGRPMLPDRESIAVAAGVLTALTVLVGLGGGLYPAFALARFRPVDVLRGRFASTRGGIRLRQGLVVFQFAVAVALLIGTLVAYGQLNHLQNAHLGFDQAQVLAIRGPGGTQPQRLAFFDALRAESAVENVASTNERFPSELLNGWGISVPGAVIGENDENFVSTRAVYVSADFFETLGVRFIAGRDYRAASVSDSAGIIVNESAARRLMAQVPGRYEDPQALVGEIVQADTARTVLGVVEDFHMASLHKEVEPIAYYLASTGTTYLARIAPGRSAEGIEAVNRHWEVFFPAVPIEQRFVNDSFAAAYRSEQQLSSLALIFAGLAILVACLGLFGLAAYAAEQRRKEIGVRKVLGASSASVVALLSRDFVKLVAVAVIIGAPVGWYATSRWLDTFPSRVDLGPEPFLAAGLLAVTVALVSVAGQALRAAMADPATSLRTE